MFQVLCLFLWSLDDYWYYSAFTLAMIMFFEAMLCIQRQKSLETLRKMGRAPTLVYCLRRAAVDTASTSSNSTGAKSAGKPANNSWEPVLSNRLVPGDVISLTAGSAFSLDPSADRQSSKDKRVHLPSATAGGDSADQFVVPCDVVIIRGSCVVNEAMLTGESTPQMKESLQEVLLELHAAAAAVEVDGSGSQGGAAKGREGGLDVEIDLDECAKGSADGEVSLRRYQLFSGTTLLQHTPPDKSRPLPAGIPSPPDRGCVAVVTRTGFGTSQVGHKKHIAAH